MPGGFEFGGDVAPDGERSSPGGARSSDDRPASERADDGVPSGPVADDGAVGVDRTDETGSGSEDTDTDAEAVDPELAALLYAGERVEAVLDVDDGRLVRTSHRLLVHTPGTAGRTLAVVQRPNVEGLALATSGRGAFVSPALKSVLVGAVLVGAGATVPVDGMAGVAPSASGAGATGMGGTVALLGGVLSALALLDDALQVLGALAMLVGVALLGLYLRSRKREVVVSVAGDEDLRVPAADATAEDVARLAPDG